MKYIYYGSKPFRFTTEADLFNHAAHSATPEPIAPPPAEAPVAAATGLNGQQLFWIGLAIIAAGGLIYLSMREQASAKRKPEKEIEPESAPA